jgi:FKBP-type peptidyl-prolyl cis-trans isomerase
MNNIVKNISAFLVIITGLLCSKIVGQEAKSFSDALANSKFIITRLLPDNKNCSGTIECINGIVGGIKIEDYRKYEFYKGHVGMVQFIQADSLGFQSENGLPFNGFSVFQYGDTPGESEAPPENILYLFLGKCTIFCGYSPVVVTGNLKNPLAFFLSKNGLVYMDGEGTVDIEGRKIDLPLNDWGLALYSNSIDGYTKYIKDNPSGANLNEAKLKIEEIKNEKLISSKDTSSNKNKELRTSFNTKIDSISYSLGTTLAKDYASKYNIETLNYDKFLEGLKEEKLNHQLSNIGAEEYNLLMKMFQKDVSDSKSTHHKLILDNKTSLITGFNIAYTMKNVHILIEEDLFTAGIKDGLSSPGNPLLSEVVVKKVLADFNDELKKKQIAIAASAQTEGEKFLKENKTKEGVISLSSGLQYKIISKSGKNEKPKAKDVVKVHYEGKFIYGDIFDSTYKLNEPALFQLNKVIPGWTEGIQLMNIGDKFELYIPANLAYGSQGNGTGEGAIPPNSVLIFTVELISIEK